jgi:spastic paraplegia 7
MEHKTFHMNIVDTNKFEEKLRAAEQRLGINSENGIPVVYERNSDTAGKLLASLIVVALLLSLLSRSKSLKSPTMMDPLVSKFGHDKFWC